MADYSDEVATALEMIADSGGPVSITSTTVTAYDPVTFQETSTPATISLIGCDLPTGNRDVAMYAGIITKSTRKILAAAAAMPAFIPEPGDRVTVEGKLWTVANLKRLIPDGVTDILWTLYVWR